MTLIYLIMMLLGSAMTVMAGVVLAFGDVSINDQPVPRMTVFAIFAASSVATLMSAAGLVAAL
jgi:hypothetical protein